MWTNYLKMAVRSLWRNRLYSLLNLVGLAVGLAASVMILLWVQSELSFDSYHREANRTYRVTNTIRLGDGTMVWPNSSLKLGETALREVPGIERIAQFRVAFQPLVFRVGEKLVSEKEVAYVDSTWFEAFDYQFVQGDSKQVLDDPNNLILTEPKARNWFGSAEAAMNKIVRLDSINMVVRAVVRDNPANSSFRYEILLPISSTLRDLNVRRSEYGWNNYNYQLFLQLKPGIEPKKVAPQLTQIYRAYKKDSSVTAGLMPLRDIHFSTDFKSDYLPKGNCSTVITLGLVGLLILVIASINYVNLTTALTSQRAKEVGMKKIVGAGRMRLFWQFMGESAIVILAALGLALGLVNMSLPLLNDFTDSHFVLDFGDISLWVLILGSTGLTLLLSGIYPSLLLSSLKPVEVLKGSNILNSQNAGFRQGLVVLQFGISLVLIVSTLVIFRQLRYTQQMNPGYQRANVFSFMIPYIGLSKSADASQFIKTRLRETSSVAGVTSADQNIIDVFGFHRGSLNWEGKSDDFTPEITPWSVEPELQSVFNLKMVTGRWFRRDMKLDSANVILNETAVRNFGLKKPIVGQWFEFQGRRGQVIGVVKDFHFLSLHQPIGPMVLYNEPNFQLRLFVKTNPKNTPRALAGTENVWKSRFPDVPFEYSFLDESFDQLYKADQKAGQLFNVFSGIAILISCLGLFGLATFTAEQRTKEIGVRKVLGASVASIVTLLSKDFLKLVLIAIVIASPIAWYAMNAWLADFAYKIDISWWVFALAGGLAVGIALLTVSFQSVRAALMNPVESLRSE